MSSAKTETASKSTINQKLNGALASFQFPAAPKKAAKAPVVKKSEAVPPPAVEVKAAPTQDCRTCSRPGTVGEQCAECIAEEESAARVEAEHEKTDVKAAARAAKQEAKARRAEQATFKRAEKAAAKAKRAEEMAFKRAERATAKAGKAELRKERIASMKAAKAEKAAEKKAKRVEAKRERMVQKSVLLSAKAAAFVLRTNFAIAVEAFQDTPSAKNWAALENAMHAVQNAYEQSK